MMAIKLHFQIIFIFWACTFILEDYLQLNYRSQSKGETKKGLKDEKASIIPTCQ